MKKLIFLLITFLMIVFCTITVSQAQSITLGFDLLSQEVFVGDQANVDLVISELGSSMAPSLGVFDLNISYDPTVLDFTGYALGPHLGDIFLGETVDFSLGEALSGVINIYELSYLYANQENDPFYDPFVPGSGFPPYLDDIQPSSFTLATLTFDTLSLGTSSLDISVLTLGDAMFPPSRLPADLESGSINVVPAPVTLFLLGSGLAGLGFFKKKKTSQAG